MQMNDYPRGGIDKLRAPIEHFQAKWMPVRVKKMLSF
jgi:hypothetical protein